MHTQGALIVQPLSALHHGTSERPRFREAISRTSRITSSYSHLLETDRTLSSLRSCRVCRFDFRCSILDREVVGSDASPTLFRFAAYSEASPNSCRPVGLVRARYTSHSCQYHVGVILDCCVHPVGVWARFYRPRFLLFTSSDARRQAAGALPTSSIHVHNPEL